MVQRALEILTDDPNRIKPFITDVWPIYGTAAFAFFGVIFLNKATRRPIFSGIQKHFIAAGLGAYIGKTVDEWRNSHMAERDAILRRYVETHPELFPDPERQKYGDLLQLWTPIR